MNNKCPGCGAAYGITPQHVGRSFTCQRCQASLVVQAGGLQIAGQPAGSSQAVQHMAGQSQEQDVFDQQNLDYTSQRRRGGSAFVDLLLFRRMIAPTVIQVVFWLAVLGCIIYGVIGIIIGIGLLGDQRSGGVVPALIAIGSSLFTMILGPFVVRLWAEIFIVIFRIHENLTNILKELKK